MKYRLFVLSILCFVTSALPAQSVTETDYGQFRKAFPYHIQTVAVSDAHQDGRRTLVVSEPPPGATLNDIRNISTDFSLAFIKKHGIGVDGWVKDVVIDLPPIGTSALTTDVDRLHRVLFGTNYKAYALSIPASPNHKVLSNLDLHVNSADLASWLLPADSASDHEHSTTSAPGLILSVLLFICCLRRLLAEKIISAVVLLLLSTAGLIMSTTSTTELVLAGSFLLLALILFFGKRPLAGSIVACLTLLFFFLGLQGSRSSDTAKTHFTPLLGGQEVTCDAILRRGLSGVFLSRPAGLVVWSLSKSKPIDSLSNQIREFALDTDRIVGAVSRYDQLVIVGRERTTDVSLLPPLRSETVMLLASAQQDELKQSYERNVVMAGRAHDQDYGERDWAPILLSSRLIDTEYGSLLNITDQLLKSWSMAGTVKYVNFQYPAPASYVFKEGLMDHLGVDNVTFNWNTKGAGYISKTGPYEIFALNRTAALPIDYLSMGRSDVRRAEDEAYDWYAGLSDPNLIRVVHYAALYQIFHHFGVRANLPEPDLTQPFEVLQKPSEKFLREIAAWNDFELALTGSWPPGFVDEIFRPTRDALKLALEGKGAFSIEQIAAASSDRSKISGLLQGATDENAEMLEALLSHLSVIAKIDTFMPEDSKTDAMKLYRKADTGHPGTWIRTPSVVESIHPGGTGGHNLGAKVTLLEVDSNIGPGSVAIREGSEGQKVIHYNPADESRVGGAVRAAARDERMSDGDIERTVAQEMSTARSTVVEPAKGLGHVNGVHPDSLRGLQMSHIEGGYTSFGWRPGNMIIGDSDAKVLAQFKGSSNQVMLLTRSNEGRYVIGTEGGRSIEAQDQASAIDGFLQLAAESSDRRIHLHTKGLDGRQAQGFLSGTGRYTTEYDVVATREEEIDLTSLKGMMTNKYDLRAAKFHDVTVSEPDSDGVRLLSQDVEIPPKASGLRAIILEIRIFFKDLHGSLEAVTQHVGSQIRAYLESFSEERDLRFAAAGLTRRLQKEGVYIDVRIEMRKNNEVAFYAYNFDPERDKERESFAN